MRTKRAQRRRARLPAPSRERLPDPFSRNNADLVTDEEALEYVCPCCIDREQQKELDAYEQWYLASK